MRCVIVVIAGLVLGVVLNQAAWAAERVSAENPGGVKSLEERVAELEAAAGREVPSDRWYDRIQVGGLVEVEAGYITVDSDDPALDGDSSDVDLATVELALDAKIHANVDGRVMLKYEDDDLFLDEGFIAVNGGEWCAGYLIAGRQYLPFGNFDSHFVTDPNTLLLGETNEGAAVVGYRFLDDTLDVSLGAFSGDARETGDDDHVDSYVASVKANPFEGLALGVSYLSNLAGSDSFNDAVVDPENLDSLVAGWSVFVTFQFLERFKLIGEVVAAVEDFEAGEIYTGDTQARKPSAWNTELGVALLDNLELAVRYGGSNDGGAEFLPETQCGAVVNWGVFKNTNLALEYLHNEFEDDYQTTDAVTAQLAIEF
jgi:hypothetical protein